MSNLNAQDYKVLSDARFAELCSVLGITKQCCFAPEQKVIEKAFRKNALKCHPDKGGDPVIFKKLNDAYNKLIGHCRKLEQQVEAEELSNSILIEISKTSVTKWHEKLNNRYGWFKSENCKNIIFEGPYKQYMGRSINTGNLTVVLYEDPPDAIPKIHVRSKKYMAWIAENNLPVHMHVEKGKVLQFDQWRIAHLAEFGINNFDNAPATPAPQRHQGKPKTRTPKTPKSKRKDNEGREAFERQAKTRRDSEPTPEPENLRKGEAEKSDNLNDSNNVNADTDDKENAKPNKFGSLFDSLSCGQCGAGFSNLMEYIGHKKVCIPDEDFGFSKPEKDAKIPQDNDIKPKSNEEGCDNKTEAKKNSKENENISSNSPTKTSDSEKKKNIEIKSASKTNNKKGDDGLICDRCNKSFTSMVQYENHRAVCKHTSVPKTKSSDIPMESLLQNLPEGEKSSAVNP